ncbi:PREDICTED: smad nuclear-interacting protein 1-like [Acropora digitifera]|uniref:smad nuclear-interacting protein 1-like n=1 Tax=Acropora digitifera TaxID=70779 RepID=UPI00077A6AC4|nr:PREDICTED: smad nuclear-interacting protein 1-like [Acropora digitifera]
MTVWVVLVSFLGKISFLSAIGRSQQERTRGRTDHERQRGRPAEDDRTNNQPNSESTDEQEVVGPNYNLSGKLTEYSNTYKGVVIKYNEPPEARKPKTRWRLYPFKGEEAMSVMYIHRQSAYLLGRQRHIVDIAIDHPSCSKQHAVLQYRLVDGKKADGSLSRKVKPYIIDLESANGTFLNNQRIDPRRFYELKEKVRIILYFCYQYFMKGLCKKYSDLWS